MRWKIMLKHVGDQRVLKGGRWTKPKVITWITTAHSEEERDQDLKNYGQNRYESVWAEEYPETFEEVDKTSPLWTADYGSVEVRLLQQQLQQNPDSVSTEMKAALDAELRKRGLQQ